MIREVARDESGNLLWSKPYPFRRLFKVGQEQVVDGEQYEVVGCKLEKDADTVHTILRRVPQQGRLHQK
jgi:hypothetical protein